MIPNPYFLLGGVLAILGIAIFAFAKGRGYERSICEWDKQEVINDNIKIRNEQDAILRPDTAAYIKRLRGGTA